MNNLLRFRNAFMAAALLAAPAACNKDNNSAKQVDRAADRVNDNAQDLRDEARDVAETARDRSKDLNDKAADKAKDTADDLNDLAKDTRERGRDDVDKTRDQATDVADNARENRDAVREKARDNATDIADEATDVGDQANNLNQAQADFRMTRMARIETLRAVQSVNASQAPLINAFATTLPLEEGDRAKVMEKLQIFQMRVDEAGNQVQALQGVEAASWEQRHDDVNKAMDRMNDARKDAWSALDDAKRLDNRTSMR
jgi:hypothetical protein